MPITRENSPASLLPDSVTDTGPAARPAGAELLRLQVRGKFLFAGMAKFFGRGVTYGPFRPEADGCEYHDRATVERDFALMAAQGINSVRTYTVPPRWLLDVAQAHGLRVLVGVPWEQHIAFLHQPAAVRDVVRRVRTAVRSCAGHPAIMGWAIGNEIPSPLVRWYGHKRVEKFLERLFWAAKDEDPDGLVTYVNYPSTEYLELPFLDFVSFNVYLEAEESLHAYVARLQNIAGERPLVMGEIGLDSQRNGTAAQAATLAWQVRLLFAEACAAVFVFAWTDEWYRGGGDIADWDFGLTTRHREPKPALAVIRDVFAGVPFPTDKTWPMISVVVCSYNGSRTLADALAALQRVTYPNFEVIVVDDGSTDATPQIARDHGFRLIQQANLGLSGARNTGWQAAQGSIIAYLDDDAAPEPHWLHFLAHAFEAEEFAGIGGSNIAFAEDNFAAHCVDHSPGNPTHVLLTDREAEHLPGCNMAYRRECLAAIGGFDARFRIAGDDVDLCWRIQERGWKIGYHAGAMVWHHRRSSIYAFFRQQYNYGRAEGLLERKWPEKYNAAGHLAWNGRLYDKSFTRFLRSNRRRIYHGSWGSALFQQLYHPVPSRVHTLLMMPEWYLITGLFAGVSGLGVFNLPVHYVQAMWVLVVVPPMLYAWRAGQKMFFSHTLVQRYGRWRLVATTALLHWLQPIARTLGRLRLGLTPWRRRRDERVIFPWKRSVNIWSENQWRSAEQRLEALEAAIEARGAVVARGGDWDRWDLEARGGMFGNAVTKLVIEEHGGGKQLVRLRLTPVAGRSALMFAGVLYLLALRAALDQSWGAWAVLGGLSFGWLARIAYECGAAMAAVMHSAPDTLGPGEKMMGEPDRRRP